MTVTVKTTAYTKDITTLKVAKTCQKLARD